MEKMKNEIDVRSRAYRLHDHSTPGRINERTIDPTVGRTDQRTHAHKHQFSHWPFSHKADLSHVDLAIDHPVRVFFLSLSLLTLSHSFLDFVVYRHRCLIEIWIFLDQLTANSIGLILQTKIAWYDAMTCRKLNQHKSTGITRKFHDRAPHFQIWNTKKTLNTLCLWSAWILISANRVHMSKSPIGELSLNFVGRNEIKSAQSICDLLWFGSWQIHFFFFLSAFSFSLLLLLLFASLPFLAVLLSLGQSVSGRNCNFKYDRSICSK